MYFIEIKNYVTFQIKYLDNTVKRYAVEVHNIAEVGNIMSDICSFDGFTYIRLNRSGKFKNKKNIRFMSKEEYFNYHTWM